MATTIMKARFPLLLLLGIVFLVSVSVCYGNAPPRQGNPCHEKCLRNCNRVNDAYRRHECEAHCEEWAQERCEEEGEEEEEPPRHKEPGRREPWRGKERQRGEEEEEEEERRERPWRPHQKEQGRKERQRGTEEGEEEEEEQPGRREPWRRKESQEEEEEEERRERQPRPWRPHQKEQGRKERQRETEEGEEEEEEQPGRREPWRRKESQEEEEEEERRERQPRPWRPHQKEQGRKERQRETEEEEEEREWRGHGRREDPEERRREQERRRRREREEEREEGEVSESSGRNNPFFFSSNNFQTRYENKNGYVRIVERFDKRSKIFENLQNYRVLEYKSKPHTLVLPHHFDADAILIVVSGRAILTLVYPNDRDSYNLERGDSITIPSGTTIYIANRDENEDLRLVKLSIPVNRPGRFRHFLPASSQNQQSYLYGFSEDVLEAAFNTEYEKIDRVLFGEERQKGQQSQEEGLIVKLSREDIQELSRHAKSSSRKTISSESKPFNLRDRNPLYSNKFGNFYEITPEKSPQLEELDIFLSWVEFKEGALLLPYFNSRSTVIGVVSEGEGELELVGLKEEQQEGEEGRRSVQRYRAKLSRGDVYVIPASHPVAINATSNLKLLGFGINAEDNERNFLAGENDNLISQIHRAVKDLAFPGSAEDLERLIRNQRHSHFANAQPQQREEGRQGRRSPLSSILGAFY